MIAVKLAGLPPYGPAATSFPRPDAFREGMVVEFFERNFLAAGAQAKHIEQPRIASDEAAPNAQPQDKGRVGRAVPAEAPPAKDGA